MRTYRRYLLPSLIGSLLVPAAAMAATARRAPFGTLPDGRTVEAVTLENAHGIRVRVLNYGARVQSIFAPDREGHFADIVLGYNNMQGYLAKRQFFGATVGRFANRIAKGRFQLDGKTYQLTINDGPNSLHGGTEGFDTRLWKIVAIKQGTSASVSMRYVSPDGDQGYPGTLTVTAIYTLHADDRLTIDYSATTDKPTIANITNHIYWNLNGEGSGTVMHERLMIPAKQFTPVDATQIPTGAFRDVAGTPFDFRKPKPIGADIHDGHSQQLLIGLGYDMNWVISRTTAKRPRLVAEVTAPASGREIKLYSNKPGLQFYSGNFLNGTTVGASGRTYRQGDAFALEPQLFPDTPNHPDFGSARLDPGQVYHNHIVYRFSTVPAGK